MGTVTIDSSNLEAVIADLTDQPQATAETKEPAKEADKPGEKEVAKVDDEAEDENGLTAADRAQLTERMQKAIGKKHRQLKEAEEFAAAQYNERRLRDAKVTELEEELAKAKQQTQPAVDPTDGKPKRESFETEDAYRDAVDDWRVDQKFKAKQAEEAKKAAQARYDEIVKEAGKRIDRAKELVPDFEEALESSEQRIPPAVANYMQESELIAELSYHFIKNPDVLDRVSKLTPARQLVEIGKIESTLKPFAKTESDAKASNGAKPSDDHAAKASPETASEPSQSRAPVIQPLKSGSAPQVGSAEPSTREVIEQWHKKQAQNVNLHRRQRH